MTPIPNLNNLIKAIECEEWRPSVCKRCEYGYYDDNGDNGIWTCNENKKIEETLFYLKLIKHLIEEKNDTL